MIEQQLAKLIELQAAQYRELRELKQHFMGATTPVQLSLPDTEPDTSDIPEQDFTNGTRGKYADTQVMERVRYPVPAVEPPEGDPPNYWDMDQVTEKTGLLKSTISGWKSKEQLPAGEFKRFGRSMYMSRRAARRLVEIGSYNNGHYSGTPYFVGYHLRNYGLWGGEQDD